MATHKYNDGVIFLCPDGDYAEALGKLCAAESIVAVYTTTGECGVSVNAKDIARVKKLYHQIRKHYAKASSVLIARLHQLETEQCYGTSFRMAWREAISLLQSKGL